jgi:hypothetical protein
MTANANEIDFVNAFHLVPQPTLTLSGRSIRPDLAIWSSANDSVRVLVECDGYQFHFGPGKFVSDPARDRELMEHDYRVLRFSGTEITNGPLRPGRQHRRTPAHSRDSIEAGYVPDGCTPDELG